MKSDTKCQHGKQQTRTAEAEEWQRNASQRENTRHRTDIDDGVRHDKSCHTCDKHAERGVRHAFKYTKKPKNQRRKYRHDHHEPHHAKRLPEHSKN